ncbi:MAG: protein kinase [Acidobacteria bacterium]|nr:protein kinase [Acidobacteriota bacterium]MCA1607909.1 protein kinase [Acidobacteriota bacterium]
MANEFEVGIVVDHFRIVSKIGSGGMGEVYLAEDINLRRKVALKRLPDDVASNSDRMRRFEQEARIAASLNHPNIAQIYEIGKSGSAHFIVMEYVDGQTLSEYLSTRSVALETILRHMQNVAEGVAKAHSAGILHRDLKPDNIMITTDGHAKVLDFGLAKLIVSSDVVSDGEPHSKAPTEVYAGKTIPGTIMGTANYMSPEQARGKSDRIDTRSDIFSFGCVLFEAVTGRRAFQGDDTLDTIIKVVGEAPQSLVEIVPELPHDLQRIVHLCLEKDPDDRFQSIKDVAIELRELRRRLSSSGVDVPGVRPMTNVRAPRRTSELRAPTAAEIGTGTGVIRRRSAVFGLALLAIAAVLLSGWYFSRRSAKGKHIESIAVMPFVNSADNIELEYLTDGMTESLINRLSKVPNLAVKGRASVFRYKGKETDSQKIGSELQVQAILNGRLQQRGDLILISLDLVDTNSGNQIWGEKYERKISELATLETEISGDVAAELREKLAYGESPTLRNPQTQNAEAYQLYQKGRFHWNKRTISDIRKSIDYFQQATLIDPNYALAFSALADSYVVLPAYQPAASHEAYPEARRAAARATELDDSLAEAHATLAAVLHSYDWKFAESEREFRRAIDLNPNYPTAHHWYAEYLLDMGRFDEALAEIRFAQSLDPLSLIINTAVGTFLTARGEFELAIEQLKKAIDMDPSFSRAHLRLALAYEGKKMFEEAIAEHEKHSILTGRAPSEAVADSKALIEALRTSGPKGYWRQLIAISEKKLTLKSGDAPPPLILATYYAQIGDNDRSLALLRNSYQQREPSVLRLNLRTLDPIRSDPRFKELIRLTGLPQ